MWENNSYKTSISRRNQYVGENNKSKKTISWRIQ